MINNKKCIICGKEYRYCPNCQEFKDFPKWMELFHNENCKKILDGVTAYGASHDLERAKAILNSCDLSIMDQISQGTKDVISEIFGNAAVESDLAQETAVEEPLNIEESEKEPIDLEYISLEENNESVTETFQNEESLSEENPTEKTVDTQTKSYNSYKKNRKKN